MFWALPFTWICSVVSLAEMNFSQAKCVMIKSAISGAATIMTIASSRIKFSIVKLLSIVGVVQ